MTFDNIPDMLNFVDESHTKFVSIKLVKRWQCKNCKQVNYNNSHACSYCGRLR